MIVLRLTHDNIGEVVRITGGRRWGGGMIVPVPGGEKFVAFGEHLFVADREKEKHMEKTKGAVLLNITVAQAGLLAEAVTAHRRTLLWTIDSLHATDEEKDVAREAIVEANLLLAIFGKVTP